VVVDARTTLLAMRRWLALIAVAGCYAPTAPVGLPCAPIGSPSRCPAGQECLVRAGAEVCMPAGSSIDIDAAVDASASDGPADAAVDGVPIDGPANWWNPSWTHRRSIDVAAGTNGTPGGYSYAVTLDHRAMVMAGASLASGDDIRIVRDDGTVMDRVLDTGSAWNTTATKLWFAGGTAASGAGVTQRFWIYYGNLAAVSGPQDPNVVFLGYQDFEGATPAWSFGAGIAVSTVRAHHGTHALATPATSATSHTSTFNTINERDVVWEVWWNIENAAAIDLSQYVRGNSTSVYMTNLQATSSSMSQWNLAKDVNSSYTEIVPAPAQSPIATADRWTRVTLYAYRSQMAVDIDGVRTIPATGFTDVGAQTMGDIGFDAWNSMGRVWWDDAVARRFVLPEPTVVVGADQTGP
jgi:hypothetical protein